jgi:surfeit locus 1 family protein
MKVNPLWSLPTIAAGLGLWQLKRLSWKKELIELAEANLQKPAVEYSNQTEEFTRVKLRGTFGDEEILVGLRTRDGQLGYLVFSPFRAQNSRAVVVNKGWIPKSQKQSNRTVQGETEIEGIIRKGERKSMFSVQNTGTEWQWIDLDAMSNLIKTDPVIVQMGENSVKLPNNHLMYAVTWFSLALTSSFLLRRFKRGFYKV